MAHIDIISYEDSKDHLREIYDDLIEKRGQLAEVHKAQSLNPESIMKHMDLYLHIMFGESPLKRYQREMIGVISSKSNNCEYCVAHHCTGLNHFWKDDDRIERFLLDYSKVGLDEVDELLCIYAEKLTKDPAGINETTYIQPMKHAGLSDRAILDATLIVSYFNFVNRMTMGLGVELEDHKGSGFIYD